MTAKAFPSSFSEIVSKNFPFSIQSWVTNSESTISSSLFSFHLSVIFPYITTHISFQNFSFLLVFSDYLFKLLLIGDSSVGKSCLLLRFAVNFNFLLFFKLLFSCYFRFFTLSVWFWPFGLSPLSCCKLRRRMSNELDFKVNVRVIRVMNFKCFLRCFFPRMILMWIATSVPSVLISWVFFSLLDKFF